MSMFLFVKQCNITRQWGRGGVNWEIKIDIYTLLYIKQITNEDKLNLEKAEEPEIKLPTYTGSQKKQENSRKIYASLTMLKSLTVYTDHNKL